MEATAITVTAVTLEGPTLTLENIVAQCQSKWRYVKATKVADTMNVEIYVHFLADGANLSARTQYTPFLVSREWLKMFKKIEFQPVLLDSVQR